MTALDLSIDRQLDRTVRLTQWLKLRSARTRALATVTHGLDFIARGVLHVWRNRRYLTVIKLINMAIINIQFKFKTERVIGRPYNMKIESTNICNTKCQLCPTGLGLQGRPKGKMDLGQYQKLIDRLKRYLFGLDLSMWGDPLIVPEIYNMVRYAHDRGIWTYLSSNLHAFKPDKGQAEALVRSGLDMLTCSLHGATQQTFEIYQPGKSFDETVAKVRHIIATRDRLGSATPQVQLNFVVTRHNEHEQAAFEQLATELGCQAVFSTASMNVRFIDRDRNLVSLGLAPDVVSQKTQDHLQDWLPTDEQYVLEPYRQMRQTGELDGQQFNGKKLFDCAWPWRMSVVNWDGSVATCCGSFDPKDDVGNVFEQPFSRVWNGPKYRMARRSFKRKLTKEQAADNPCANCPGFML